MKTCAINSKPFIGMLLAFGLSGAAQATLIDRGSGLIYDDQLDITWLQDANYAKTSGYDADGMMTWADANAWAANLSYYDSVRGYTYTDWRLPFVVDTDGPDADALGNDGCTPANSGTDCGYNVQTKSGATVYSELAYMYYVNLGLDGYFDTSGTYQPTFGIFGNGTYNGANTSSYGQNDVGLIDNLQAGPYYWSATEYASSTSLAWLFVFNTGGQGVTDKSVGSYAWAVRSGDVMLAYDPDPTPNPAPEPATLALLAMGLLGMVGSQALRKERPGSMDFQGAQGA
jgi:hypothetical protein